MITSSVNETSLLSLFERAMRFSLKGMKQGLFTHAEKTGATRFLQLMGSDTGSHVYVLAYHRVDTFGHRPWLNPELINATPEQFIQQMALLQRDYNPISIGEVLEAAEGGKKLPRQAVLVTVDDGYKDFSELILPVCGQFGIRPLLFVPTGFAGQGIFWWDKLYQIVNLSGWKDIIITDRERVSIANNAEKAVALKYISGVIKSSNMEHGIDWLDELYLQYQKKGIHGEDARSTLNWDELRLAARSGADIAAHTHSHPILSRISLDSIRQEIRQSRAILKTELGNDLNVFAYPDGLAEAISPEARSIVVEEGIKLAFTMQSRRADLNLDPHDILPRLGTRSKLNLGHFHFLLTPIFSYVKSKRTGSLVK